MTFYWKSTTVTNEEVINSNKINFENIEFGWCADFDKEYFLRIENNKIVHDIQSKVLGFKYVANFDLFPDLSFHFELKIKPSQSIIEDLNRLMINNFKKSYVSDVSVENLQLHAIVDFQDTTIDDGITEINQFIMDYRLSSLKELTKSISIN